MPPAPVMLAQQQVNALQLPRYRGRYAFWNLENLTGDVIHYGDRVQQESLQSPSNQFRMECVAQAIHRLDLDGLVLLELGSDGETVVRSIAARCDALFGNPNERWEFTISQDNGPKFPMPGQIELDLSPWMDYEARTLQLLSLFTAYLPSGGDLRAIEGPAYVALYRELQKRVIRHDLNALITISWEYEDPPDSLADAMAWVHGKIQIPDIDFLTAILTGKATLGAMAVNLGFDAQLASAIFCSRCVQRLELRLYAEPDVPAVHRALRHYGHNTGRYEKYGAITRVRRAEFLEHRLITDTAVQQHGLATNSRCAWRLFVALRHQGGGDPISLPIYVIHSMYSKARGVVSDQSAREARIETLVAQAQYAQQRESHLARPVVICGDMNIVRADIGGANGRMIGCGYSRRGAGANAALLSTSLRAENTILTMTRRQCLDEGFGSEPYDLVFAKDDSPGLTVTVEYPADLWDIGALIGAQNDFVREWFCRKCQVVLTSLIHAAGSRHVTLNANLAQRVLAVEELLRGDLPARYTAITALQADLSPFANDEPPHPSASLFWERMRIFCDLTPGNDRLYALFHRSLISDHRICVFTLEFDPEW